MPFVCTTADFLPELINEDLVFPIGYDDENPLYYSVLMGFSPMPGGDVEFYWVIIEADKETGEERALWSGLETKDIIGKAERILVRTAVLSGIEYLLERVKPNRVFCCTHDSDLPRKALYKHSLVAAQFKLGGYSVSDQPEMLGKQSWWAELPDVTGR